MKLKMALQGCRKKAVVCLALTIGLVACSDTLAITIRHDVPEADYIALSTMPKWSAAGVYTTTSTCFASGGTLIHPEWAITAGHCLNASAEFALGANRSTPDIQVAVDFTRRHTGYDINNVGNGKDLGLSKLVAPILDATPVRLYRGDLEKDQLTTVIGYGRFGTGSSGATTGGVGVRRAGQNNVDGFGLLSGVSNQVMIIDFDNPNNPVTNHSGPATPVAFEHGIALYDSGSGWFADIDGSTQLIGVTSFRAATDGSDNSDYGDIFGGTRVSREIAWIDSEHDHTMFWDTAHTATWDTSFRWETGVVPGATNAAVIDGGHPTVSQPATAEYTFLVGTGELTLQNTLTTNNFLLRESATLNPFIAGSVLDGQYAQSGGTLAVDLFTDTLSDTLTVTGDAELGGTIAVVTGPSYGGPANRGETDSHTVLNANSLTDEFDVSTFNGSPITDTMGYVGEHGDGGDGLFAAISYTGTSVEIESYFALEGDANGDGAVDDADFDIWNAHKFTSGTDWTTGDFNNDGVTNGRDFLLWNRNKFTTVALPISAVPEPSLGVWLFVPVLFGLRRRSIRGR